MTLEQALRSHLEQTSGLTLDYVEDVKVMGVLGPGLVNCDVRFQSRWQAPVTYTEQDIRNAVGEGYKRAVELMRQTGRNDLAEEMERAWTKAHP